MNEMTEGQRKGCWGCLAVIAIMIAAIMVPAAISDARRNARIEREMKGRPAISVLPAQLAMDATGALYNDKVVQVRGIVVDKYADAAGVIVLLGSGVGQDGIYCNFGPQWWPNVSKWSKGDRMDVRGVVSSGYGLPSLRRCQIDAATE